MVPPQTQTKGFFTLLEEIVLQVALPSDAGEGQICALLIYLQGGESAGGHFERSFLSLSLSLSNVIERTFPSLLHDQSPHLMWHPGTQLSPNPALWLLCLPENSGSCVD